MENIKQWLHRCTSPKFFYEFSGSCLPWLAGTLFILLGYGLWGGLVLSPPDYQQGDGFRIIYVHVPSAFLSLFAYVVMAVASAIYLVWRIKIAYILASASAPIGALFTGLALITGAIWGKPMWGTWWVWDARLTSELILLLLYFAYLLLQSSIPEPEKASKIASMLAVVGVLNIPIIHYSVEWWYTLHQGATLSKFSKPSMHPAMLWPLLAMIGVFLLYFWIDLLIRSRTAILEREHQSQWVKFLYE